MTVWLIVALFALCFAGVAWYVASGVDVKAGWQNGKSLIARHLDARRRAQFDLQLPEALATMSNSLRAGFSISQAFDSVVEQGSKPMSEEFAILQQQLKLGMNFEDALESMASRVGSEDFTLVATAILISRRTGGNVIEIFDRISETIRGRMRVKRKIRSLTAQGRLQGIVVSLMPVFLCLVMTLVRPDLMLPFLTSAAGLAAVVVMTALIAAGWLMIRRIINIDI